jgi:Ca-activated chloride channel family protein
VPNLTTRTNRVSYWTIPVLTLALLCSTTIAARPGRPTVDSTTIVRGRVTDPAGRPIGDAIVTGTARNLSTRTNSSGYYSVGLRRNADVEQAELVIRHIGYEDAKAVLQLRGDSVTRNVTLTPRREVVAQVDSASATIAAVSEIHAAPATIPLGSAVALQNAPPYPKLVAKKSRVVARSMIPMRMSPPAYGSADQRTERRRYGVLRDSGGNTESYDHIDENPFRSPRVAPMSTFSVDVDRASYTNVRRYLNQGALPPKDAVRIEELVNYFPYDDAAPRDGDVPLRVTTEIAPAPWNTNHELVRIALRARDIDMRHAPASNLVFLVDVSGSMMGPGRLPLVKESLALLVNELREEDRVAIVVYAGNAGLVLPSTSDKQRILGALGGLEAGGSTAGGAGIRLAYDVAKQNFIAGGNNRVILCTDGDFNVGQSSDGELVNLIEQRRKEGSFLTILGFGMGNYKDSKMEKLAGAGNGNYGYIDDLLEARKMLVKEMGGTLHTVAKDVKLQVEFNPSRVQAYRLLGYEDRLLRDEDFTNDAKDAGDVGAGHTVTALYEIVTNNVPLDVKLPDAPTLRYQHSSAVQGDPELLHVAMRYKAPDGEKSMLMTYPVRAPGAARHTPSESMRFSSAVAGFGMLLRSSPNSGELNWQQVISLAKGAQGSDEDGYRSEFIRLAETAARLQRPHYAVDDRDR